MNDLNGKVAIVTGAGQGVGRGIAIALAKRGVTVALVGRTSAKLHSVAQEIQALDGRADPFSCDITDAAQITATIEAVTSLYGRIDILVNNAQQVPLGPLLHVEDGAFQAGFDSGPLATMRFMKGCYPALKASGQGMIFNMASSAARRWDMSNYGAYAAVKEAIRALTRAAAAEWGGDNIRVLTIAPHADSPALKGWIADNPDEAKAFFKTIPLGHVGDCETDIGNAIAALCSPDFAYLTGATIPLDGGQANFD